MKNKSSLMIAVSAFALIGVITLAVLLSGCVNEEADKTMWKEANGIQELSNAEDRDPEKKEGHTVVSDTETMEKAVGTEAEKVSEAPDATASDEPTVTERWEDSGTTEAADEKNEPQSTTAQESIPDETSVPAVTDAKRAENPQTQPETKQTPPVTQPAPSQTTPPETIPPETVPSETTAPEITAPETTVPPTIERDEPKAADFTVYDENGNEVRLSDYAGKPVVLNFWASWCGPCMREMPHFNEKYLELSEGVVFLMVNVTNYDTASAAKEVISENGYSFPVFFDTYGEANEAYGVTGFPTTYFIDAEGYIIAYARGAISAEALQEGIELIS